MLALLPSGAPFADLVLDAVGNPHITVRAQHCRVRERDIALKNASRFSDRELYLMVFYCFSKGIFPSIWRCET